MKSDKKLTVKEVAVLLECSRGAITKKCRNGDFPNAEKLKDTYGNEYWLIPEADLKDVEIKIGRPKKGK